jgi:hypothetical protein
VGCALNAFFADQSQDAVLLDWDLGDGAGSTDVSFEHSYAIAGSYTVQLLVESADGCVDSMSVIVDIPAIVEAAFVFTYDQCEQVFHFTNNSQNAITYTWPSVTEAILQPPIRTTPLSFLDRMRYRSWPTTTWGAATPHPRLSMHPRAMFPPDCSCRTASPRTATAQMTFSSWSGMPQCFDPALSIFKPLGRAGL